MNKDSKMKKANPFMVTDAEILDITNNEFIPVFLDKTLLKDGEVDSFIGQSPPKSTFLLPGKSASTGTKSANFKPSSTIKNVLPQSKESSVFLSNDNSTVKQADSTPYGMSRCATSPTSLHMNAMRLAAGESNCTNLVAPNLSRSNDKLTTSEISLETPPPSFMKRSPLSSLIGPPPPPLSKINGPSILNPVSNSISSTFPSPPAGPAMFSLNPVASIPVDTFSTSSTPLVQGVPMYQNVNDFHGNAPVSAAGMTCSAPGPYSQPLSSQALPPEFPNQFIPYQNEPERNFLPSSFQKLAMSGSDIAYHPVQTHWFYGKVVNGKTVWFPFTLRDSLNLEDACHSADTDEATLVATDGGRYDVNIMERKKYAVYWSEDPMPVRRSSWFYKSPLDTKFTPYEEKFASKLEEEYQNAVMCGQWHRKIEFPGGQKVMMHSPNIIVHFTSGSSADEWIPGSVETNHAALSVKRGANEFDISDGEPVQIDHLVFVVHGCGSVCDFKFRVLNEVVDDFRGLSNQMVQTHYKTQMEVNQIGRVEYLPISWHQALHGDETGIDEKLKYITLRSIPKLRHFTNDTLLDILFYTSPVYCQHIMETVGYEINRLYHLFLLRNPDFSGKLSLVGHSLGSLILFDLLLHQLNKEQTVGILHQNHSLDMGKINSLESEPGIDSVEGVLKVCDALEYHELLKDQKIDFQALLLCNDEDLKTIGIPFGPRKKIMTKVQEIKMANSDTGNSNSNGTSDVTSQSHAKSVNYKVGPAGTGQPYINYPKLDFSPAAFFALGSPIAMFVTVRGLETLGEDFKLPTCSSVYNIFHPYDPVAYRLETLLNPKFNELRPVLIPHHKGRKRMHLELKETMQRVGSDLKARLYESFKSTWNSLYRFNLFSKAGEEAHLEAEVNKCLEEEILKHDHASDMTDDPIEQEHPPIGNLNGGRRIDYVLQERPIESFNEYLFAMSSHLCYWTSEDTVLMIVREIYSMAGIHPDDLGKAEPISGQTPALQINPSFPPFITPNNQVMPSSVDLYQMSDPPVGTNLCSFPTYPQGISNPHVPPVVIGSRPLANQPPCIGMDPTAPPSEEKVVGPPPMVGFVKQR